MKKVLVTGGMGFLGRHIVPALLDAGHSVRILGKNDAEWRHPSSEFVCGSMTDPKVVTEAIDGCDVVIHLASSTIPSSSNADPVRDVEENLIGTLNILESCRSLGCKRIVFASSGGTVYGSAGKSPIDEKYPTDPLCSYGIIKLAIEKYLAMYSRLYGIHTVALRISNLYGEYQRHDTGLGVIAAFSHRILNNEPLEIWGDGSIARDFIYVGDVVCAILSAMSCDNQHLVANVGSGKSVSLNEIVNILENITGKKAQINFRPGREFDVKSTCLDIEIARDILGWNPNTDLHDGIFRLLNLKRNVSNSKAGIEIKNEIHHTGT